MPDLFRLQREIIQHIHPMKGAVIKMDTEAISRLREKILASDNRACFIERETLLRTHAEQTRAQPEEERYLYEFDRTGY